MAYEHTNAVISQINLGGVTYDIHDKQAHDKLDNLSNIVTGNGIHFAGTTTAEMTDGQTETPAGITNPDHGSVVIDKNNREYIYVKPTEQSTGVWHEFGRGDEFGELAFFDLSDLEGKLLIPTTDHTHQYQKSSVTHEVTSNDVTADGTPDSTSDEFTTKTVYTIDGTNTVSASFATADANKKSVASAGTPMTVAKAGTPVDVVIGYDERVDALVGLNTHAAINEITSVGTLPSLATSNVVAEASETNLVVASVSGEVLSLTPAFTWGAGSLPQSAPVTDLASDSTTGKTDKAIKSLDNSTSIAPAVDYTDQICPAVANGEITTYTFETVDVPVVSATTTSVVTGLKNGGNTVVTEVGEVTVTGTANVVVSDHTYTPTATGAPSATVDAAVTFSKKA